MKITLSNNITIRGCPTPLKLEITKALTMDNPEYVKRKKRKRPTWGIDAKIKNYSVLPNGDLVCPRGFALELRDILGEGFDYMCIDNFMVKGQKIDFGNWNGSYQLYKYQRNAVESFLKTGNGVIIAPAGSGKTNMALNAVYNLSVPTLWLTHTKDLMYQTKERAESLMDNLGEVGLLGDGHKSFGSKKLIIGMVQTLQRNPELVDILKDFIGFVVIDESHRTPSSVFIDIINQFPARNMLGVTATPDRKDQLERLMYLAIGKEVARIDRQQLYDDGALIKPKVAFIFTDFQQSTDDSNMVDAGGEDLDYNALMNELLNDEDRAKLIAENIVKAYHKYGTSIVLAENIKYCYKLKERVDEILTGAYIKGGTTAVAHSTLSQYTWHTVKTLQEAEYAVRSGRVLEYKKSGKSYKIKVEQYTDQEMKDWKLTKKQRLEVIDKFKSGEIDILFATQLAREGLDVPHVCVGHMVTPKRGDTTKDRDDGSAVEQEIGRIMRADKNNPDKVAYWFDYVDDKVGVFKSQYYSRRAVYKRLLIDLPRKVSNKQDELSNLLKDLKY